LVSIGANRGGIFSLTGCMAAYAVSDVATKFVGRTHPFGEVIAARGLFTIVLIGILLVVCGSIRHIRSTLTPLVLVRSVLEALASVTYVAALIHMPIANAAALVMVQPLLLVVLSVVVHADKVGWRRWTAIMVGLAGVMFIVKPTPTAFDGWAVLGLSAALFGAVREMVTRRLDPALPNIVIAFMSAIALTLAGAAFGLGEQWRAIPIREVAYLAIADLRCCAVSLHVPGLCGDRGIRLFRMALIVGSGLYTLHRDALRRRAMIPSA
jgi:drug/metabolite transporter (DMT)-like permease